MLILKNFDCKMKHYLYHVFLTRCTSLGFFRQVQITMVHRGRFQTQNQLTTKQKRPRQTVDGPQCYWISWTTMLLDLMDLGQAPAPSISLPLSRLLNHCIDTGTFPLGWKFAKVTVPIYCRPICVLL